MPTLRPLTDQAYFALVALIDQPLHGYAIMQRVADLSEGRLRPTTGTLFGALERMAEQGLVVAGEIEVVTGRARRAYELTPRGQAAISDHAATLGRAADVGVSALRSARIGSQA